jgi:hypothetical protein
MKIIELKEEITESGKFAIVTYEDNGQTFTKREEYDKAITNFKRNAIEVTDKLGENFYQFALISDVTTIRNEYLTLIDRFNKFSKPKETAINIQYEEIAIRTYANMLAIKKAVKERNLFVMLNDMTLPDGFLDYFRSQDNCQWLIDKAPTNEQPTTKDDNFIKWYGTQKSLCQDILDNHSEKIEDNKSKIISILRMELPKYRIEKKGKWTAIDDPVLAYHNWRKTGAID